MSNACRKAVLLPVGLLLLSAVLSIPSTSAAAEPRHQEWTVDGRTREALLYLPTKATEHGAPVVFGFHGHGGSMQNAARSFRMHELWPEALVVYMQGIPTPGRLTDPEGKRNGWQHDAGDHEDRDLKFFDAVFKSLRDGHQIDENRIYCMGHSNGGAFTYLLWAERPDLFAAVAPSGAASRRALSLQPKPAMHVAGENDPLVRFAVQELTMRAVRRINGCQEMGEAWADVCTLYPSSTVTPFVSYIHKGGHKYPAEAPALIVRFFREHVRPAAANPAPRPRE